jgi:alpha-L-fucosidase
MALVEPVMTALRMPQRWSFMVDATFLTGASRQRSIQPSSCRQLFSAHVREVNDQSWPKPPQQAIEDWKDLRFGMFIHWGPSSQVPSEISWSRGSRSGNNQEAIEKYDKLYTTFNPTRFDADAWVAAAKSAGMTYIVLTAKHHDGFCLWPSKFTDHSIANTPFKRDVVGELAAACRRGGIKLGLYYSQPDWHHPLFPPLFRFVWVS